MNERQATSPAERRPARVLIVYSSNPPIIAYFQRAFERAGVETDYLLADDNTWFDRWIIHSANKWLHNLRILPKNRFAFADHPLAHKNYRSRELERKIDEFAPQFVLLIRGISYNPASLRKAPRLFGWWIEREERVQEALREIELFDWYYFMNRSCVETAHAQGFENSSYLPHSVDAAAFRPLPDCEKRYDLCFVGNWSEKRQAYLEAALKVTPNIAIYGRKWRKKNLLNWRLLRCVKGKYIEGEDLNRLYNASCIVLNVTNWGKGEGARRSGMNMRVLEVPATGAFLLTDGSRELAEFLTAGEHAAVYEGIEDFERSLHFWLARPQERAAIAAAGQAHVAARFSYDRLVADMLQRYAALLAGDAPSDTAAPPETPDAHHN